MKKKSLSSKEKEFCRLYLSYADPGAAAEGAGFEGDFLKIGNALLSRDEVSEEIERLCNVQKKSMAKMAAVGYQKLAFGSIADAVSLLYKEKPCLEELRKMDLFSISEIKRPKDGSVEIKFFDRMKALEKLSENEQGDGAHGFYEAICRSAKILSEKEKGLQ
ncbi:MAG: terminase small subunit [Ruminococcaceae bacterium]|nr:terminase small subunit [Oscillospiraceae bacterium]